MKETISRAAEAEASFINLIASEKQEMVSAGTAVEEKTGRMGELAVSTVQAEADPKDTQEAMDVDTKFTASVADSCATKSKEWDARSKFARRRLRHLTMMMHLHYSRR